MFWTSGKIHVFARKSGPYFLLPYTHGGKVNGQCWSRSFWYKKKAAEISKANSLWLCPRTLLKEKIWCSWRPLWRLQSPQSTHNSRSILLSSSISLPNWQGHESLEKKINEMSYDSRYVRETLQIHTEKFLNFEIRFTSLQNGRPWEQTICT